MGNKKTPLLLSLRQSGGTLYVFPSAYEDIGLNLLSTTTGVAMSHYALINIPELSKKLILKNAPFSSAISELNGNDVYALSLQDYVMNFETYLINREEYNYQELSTVSERVFWNWMRHIGAIKDENLADSSAGEGIYYEENQNNPNQIVKCVGSIDAGNTLSTEFGIYNETYINIPTSYGSARYYFEVLEDANYNSKDSYIVNNLDINKLQGRDDNVDYYSYHLVNGVTLDQPIYSSNRGNIDQPTNNAYVVFGPKDSIVLAKDINNLSKYYNADYNNGELITSFDDININVDNIRNDVKTEFDFNAILLYYSVYDQDDIVKTSYATNLFGIIFIDGTKSTEENDGIEALINIPTLKKKKSNNKQFGNSYSFRVNLKTQSVYDNTETIIQDNTTSNSILSVELSDVISLLNIAIDTLNTNTQVVAAIQDKYAAILSRYDDLREDIEELQLTLDQFIKGVKSNKLSTKNMYVEKIIKDASVDKLVICETDDVNATSILSIHDSNVHVNDLYVDANYDVNDSEIDNTTYVNDHINNLKVYKKDNGEPDNYELYITDLNGLTVSYNLVIPLLLSYIKNTLLPLSNLQE